LLRRPVEAPLSAGQTIIPAVAECGHLVLSICHYIRLKPEGYPAVYGLSEALKTRYALLS
jgi:hypothetical protein